VPARPLTTWQEIVSFARERLWAFALVIAAGCLVTILLFVNTWIAAFGSALPFHEASIHAVAAATSIVVITGVFAAIYKVAPEPRVQWRDAIPGAAITSVFFTLGNILLGLYLGRATFASTYGAAASMVLLALWLYYSSQIFFLGAEFTRAFSKHHSSPPGSHGSA